MRRPYTSLRAAPACGSRAPLLHAALLLLGLAGACAEQIEPRLRLETHQDDLLYVGMAKVDIMPVPFNRDGTCPEGKFCFETFTNLGKADGCPDNRNNNFEGVLTRPARQGCAEPFDDANRNGFFDGLWLGGYNMARAATAHDRDVSIYAKVLVLTRNDEHVVLINLPFVGFPTLQLSFFKERLAALSDGTLEKDRIIPMAIHNHGVPDTQGLWGPDLLRNHGLKAVGGLDLMQLLSSLSGLFDRIEFPLPSMNYRNNAYWYWVEEKSIEAVEQAIDALEPAGVKLGVRETPHRETGCQTQAFAGKVEIDCDADGVVNEGHDIGSYSGGSPSTDCLKKSDTTPVRLLVEDARLPVAMDYNVYTLQFVSRASSKPIGTFLVWGFHVEEADRENTKITGDIAEYACDFIERRGGGICLFQIGPEGGLTSSNTGAIPYVDERGFYYDCQGNSLAGSDQTDDAYKFVDQGELKLQNTNYEDAIAAGRNVAKTSLASLAASPTVHHVAGLRAKHLAAFLPLDNPFLFLGGKLEILNGMSLLLRPDIDKERAKKVKELVFRSEISASNEACGGAVCIRAPFALIDLDLVDPQNRTKRVALATAPGELFPEYLVGRQASRFKFHDIEASGSLKGLADLAKDPKYPSQLLTTDINPQVFVEVEGLKQVGRKLGYDQVIVLAQANGSLGYMMPRTDYLPVYEGYFDLIRGVVPAVDTVLAGNGGVQKIFKLTEADRHATLRNMFDQVFARYAIYVQNYRPPTGGDVRAADHPNSYEETVSAGPRAGDIVYNAMVGLATKGTYLPRVRVPSDPNTDSEVLSLGKLR